MLIGARRGSPLVVGYGDGETYIGSDALALAPLTQQISYLEEGDWVVVTREAAEIHDAENQPVEREIQTSGASAAAVEKGNYRHFMQKEIFEQPRAITDTIGTRVNEAEQDVDLDGIEFDKAWLDDCQGVTLVACGTSYYASLLGKYMIEQIAGIPCEVDLASEFRYRKPIVGPRRLVIPVSQSGETADSLGAIKEVMARGANVKGVVNVVGSTIARTCGAGVYIHSGPEVAVASTKAFTSQVTR